MCRNILSHGSRRRPWARSANRHNTFSSGCRSIHWLLPWSATTLSCVCLFVHTSSRPRGCPENRCEKKKRQATDGSPAFRTFSPPPCLSRGHANTAEERRHGKRKQNEHDNKHANMRISGGHSRSTKKKGPEAARWGTQALRLP